MMPFANWYRFALILLLVLCSIFPIKSNYFYIYEWPDLLDDVWPPMDATLHRKSGYDHAFRDNYGAGAMLDNDNGLFQTWQFSLYKTVISRLRVSEYRTRDPSKATSFIVPFDLGVHSYIDHLTGEPRLAAPHGRQAGRLLREYCNGNQRDIFWKNQGHDHFVLFSITAYQMVGMMVKEFYMFICQNCTVITIETSPTKTAIPGRTRKGWFAAPYPSSFHWHESIKYLPWEVPKSNSNDKLKYPERNILALFIGSVKPSQPASRALRQTLHAQCIRDDSCQWHETAHACNGVVNATNTMLLFRKSVFCPAPAGDSITRKSIFDALVAGCIPVLFSRASLSQYSWHVSSNDLSKISLYIPMQDINEGGRNFLDILKSIPNDVITQMQLTIEKIAPTLQYSVIPKSIGNLDSGKIWKSPFKDAADVIIEKILDRQTVHPINGWSNEELLRQHHEQKEIMEYHEDFAALRGRASSRNEDKINKKIAIQTVDENGNLPKTLTKSLQICAAI